MMLAACYGAQGDPAETLPQLCTDTGAGLLVTDYSPLRLGRQWRNQVSRIYGAVSLMGADSYLEVILLLESYTQLFLIKQARYS
jgi:hypothetical protein